MGIFTWLPTHMMTSKFWKLVAKDGFIRTHQRGHQAYRPPSNQGGHSGAVKMAGQDHFGNRYYEDFSVDHYNCRRWVEYSNYFLNFGWGTDRIPPGWHGWMSHTYDDVPTDDSVFVDHPFIKGWQTHPTGTPDAYNSPGAVNPFNTRDAAKFRLQQLEKHHSCFKMPENPAGQVYDGKKMIVEKHRIVEDPMLSY